MRRLKRKLTNESFISLVLISSKSKQDKLLWDYSAHINLAEKIHFKILKKEIL